MSPTEAKVLAFLAEQDWEFGCYPFAPIAEATGLDTKQVRRACRSLKRKGLAEFHAGLWHEDGGPAGAGYEATSQGRALHSKENGDG